MKRYLTTLRLFITTSLSAEMEYRANFILAFLSSLVNLAGSIFGLSLLFQNGHKLGGWQWEEALIVMGLFTVLDGFSGACLKPNLSRIVQQVREGTMDFILLKPIDGQFWLSTRNFSLWGLPNLLFGIGIIVYSGQRLGLSAGQYLLGIMPALLSITILYSIWFALAATSVWFVKVHNLSFLLRSFLEAGRYPTVAYPAVYRFFFTFILPVTFMTTVPAQAILGRAQLSGVALACGLAIVLFAIARRFWHFSLRYYTSASS
jgi:ABC-2 type transport system permease protein